MIKFTSTLYEQFIADLNEIARQSNDHLLIAEQSYQVTYLAIQKINDFLLEYTFKDQAEEIRFFKEIKPKFLTEMIYFQELYHIEAHKPVGFKELIRQHYQQAAERVRSYFVRNEILYNYYRMNKTLYDDFFFVRNTVNEFSAVENAVDIDHRCSTVYSIKLSKLLAYELISEYLQAALFRLDNPDATPASHSRKVEYKWTDSKAALIEIAYMIYVSGSVNNGKGELSQIIAGLQSLFNINLGNYSRTFDKMRFRKKSQTPYIDDGKNNLIRMMNDV